MCNAMYGAMHGSIRNPYVKRVVYRKLNICKTSGFPNVAKSWCSKLYGLCTQSDLPSATTSRLTLTRVPKALDGATNGAATMIPTLPRMTRKRNEREGTTINGK